MLAAPLPIRPGLIASSDGVDVQRTEHLLQQPPPAVVGERGPGPGDQTRSPLRLAHCGRRAFSLLPETGRDRVAARSPCTAASAHSTATCPPGTPCASARRPHPCHTHAATVESPRA